MLALTEYSFPDTAASMAEREPLRAQPDQRHDRAGRRGEPRQLQTKRFQVRTNDPRHYRTYT